MANDTRGQNPIQLSSKNLAFLTLDTILSSMFHQTVTWSDQLQSNKARDLLRYLVCRLFDQGRGNLMNAQLELAQTTLAQKLGMSRQWVGELTQRLEAAGWIEHFSPKLADGTNGSTVWRIGRQFKRLLVMLRKSKQRKPPTKSHDKSRWHFSPISLEIEKIRLRVQEKEQEPPAPSLIAKIPILGTWLKRGKEVEKTESSEGDI